MIEIELKEAPIRIKEGAIIAVNLEGGLTLICDATNADAVNLLRKVKKRPLNKGFTILVDCDARVNRHVHEVPPLAWDILDASEDPLILVLPKGKNVSPTALAKDGSIALRMVKSVENRKLVQAANGPLLTTSITTIEGGNAEAINKADPDILAKVDYVLTLPTAKMANPLKKIPIVSLGLDNSVSIIRE